MIIVKTDREIEMMREAGRIIAAVLDGMKTMIKPGVTTLELDQWAEQTILRMKGKPAFKGYGGGENRAAYPATICASINEEVVHGVPSRERILQEGDIIGIDVGSCYQGYYSDGAWTYAVGPVSSEARRLMTTCKNALDAGIKEAVSGNCLGDLSRAIDRVVRAQGFEIVRDLTGHGIGRQLHEDPQILNFDTGMKGPRLRTGMTLAIEPMINAGGYEVKTLADQWTVVTVDHSLSAHYEHSVVITENGPEILTRL